MFWRKKPSTVPNLSRNRVFPRIKPAAFLDSVAGVELPFEILPSSKIPQKNFPITHPLVGDLLVAYAFDTGGVFQMISESSLGIAAVRLDELYDLAICNLQRVVAGKIKGESHGSVCSFTTGDDLASCLILIPSMWNAFVQGLKGELVVAVPCREYVFCTESTNSDGLDLLRKATDEAYFRESVHAISRRFFVWRNSQWEQFSAPAGENVIGASEMR